MSNKKEFQPPIRFFEDSGMVDPAKSYYVPLENVTNTKRQDMKTMVDLGRYFSIFAPRQSGKTTFFKRICDQLHKDRTYIAIILNFEKFEQLDKSQFYARIEKKLYPQLLDRLREVECVKCDAVEQFLDNHRLTDHLTFGDLFDELNRIIQAKKIVVFIDEFDGIPRKELGNFLTTIRSLYHEYKEVERKALYSIGLIGIRNITKLIVGGVSPFNIADQVELPPFSLKNITDLYGQYTSETNQAFSEAALKRVFHETGGQPWLVNRLGTILTADIKPDTIETIGEEDVEKAIQIILQENANHFDNLYEKAKLYKETFVKIVFNNVKYNVGDNEQAWLEQYGLIKKKAPKAVPANPIYRKRFLDIFFQEAQVPTLAIDTGEYASADGALNMHKVLTEFETYIAQIGVRAFYAGKKPYEKTGQFLLTAWLYQFAKDKTGDLRYETPTGLGRMDIILKYKGVGYIIETKVNTNQDIKSTLSQGLTQVAQKYLATEPDSQGFLVIFDTQTQAGTVTPPRVHHQDNKTVTTFIIGIGYAHQQAMIYLCPQCGTEVTDLELVQKRLKEQKNFIFCNECGEKIPL